MLGIFVTAFLLVILQLSSWSYVVLLRFFEEVCIELAEWAFLFEG